MLLLLVGSLSGCLSISSSQEDRFEIPDPERGATYLYSGGNALLYANVTDLGPRVDDRLDHHEAVLISIEYRPSPEARFFSYVLAIDAVTGLVVHETATCALPAEDGSACARENRAAILFGDTGLPGAFGIGPLWGRTLPNPGALNVSTYADGDEETATYRFTSTPTGPDPRCVESLLEDAEPTETALPFGVDQGPMVLCPGLALPWAFEAPAGTLFELVEREPGNETIEPEDTGPAWTDGRAVPLRTWSSPLLVHDPSDPAPLTVEEAHEEALGREERYAQFFERNPDALLVKTHVSQSGRATMLGTAERVDWQRRLTAAAPSGAVIALSVVETRVENRTTGYAIEDVEEGRSAGIPTGDQLPTQIARLGPAMDLGRQITQRPVDTTTGWGLPLGIPGSVYLKGGPDEIRDGPEVNLWFLPEGLQPDDAGTRAWNPWHMVVDGKTGHLIFAERAASELPFDGRHLD